MPAFFHVPKKTAAVSGVGGSTTATRSPRSTPWSRRTLAAWLERSCSSPQVDVAASAVEALPDHGLLVARVLVADVGGDVVALGHVPLVLGAELVVAAHGRILAHHVFARWRSAAPGAASAVTVRSGVAARRLGQLGHARRPARPGADGVAQRGESGAGASRVRRLDSSSASTSVSGASGSHVAGHGAARRRSDDGPSSGSATMPHGTRRAVPRLDPDGAAAAARASRRRVERARRPRAPPRARAASRSKPVDARAPGRAAATASRGGRRRAPARARRPRGSGSWARATARAAAARRRRPTTHASTGLAASRAASSSAAQARAPGRRRPGSTCSDEHGVDALVVEQRGDRLAARRPRGARTPRSIGLPRRSAPGSAAASRARVASPGAASCRPRAAHASAATAPRPPEFVTTPTRRPPRQRLALEQLGGVEERLRCSRRAARRPGGRALGRRRRQRPAIAARPRLVARCP